MIECFRLTAADAPWLATLQAAAFPDEPWPAAVLVEMLTLPTHQGFGIRKEERPIGFILFTKIHEEIEILSIAVEKESQRQGGGARLLRAALNLPHRLLHLEVAADNAAAIAFYRREGFQETGRRPGYYRRATGTMDALRLARAVGSSTSPPLRPSPNAMPNAMPNTMPNTMPSNDGSASIVQDGTHQKTNK